MKRKRLRQIDLDRIVTQLPVAKGPPGDLSKLQWNLLKSFGESAAHDCLSYSIWQSKTSTAIWIRMTGGIAGGDVWYGPGERQLIDAFKEG